MRIGSHSVAHSLGSEGVMCLIRKTRFRINHCREGNDDPRLDIGFTLDRWIRETPRIRSAIIWRPDASRVLAYRGWSRADKDRLARLYDRLKAESDAGLSEDPPIEGFQYYDAGRGTRDNPVNVVGHSGQRCPALCLRCRTTPANGQPAVIGKASRFWP
jgi:hypothetical protein